MRGFPGLLSITELPCNALVEAIDSSRCVAPSPCRNRCKRVLSAGCSQPIDQKKLWLIVTSGYDQVVRQEVAGQYACFFEPLTEALRSCFYGGVKTVLFQVALKRLSRIPVIVQKKLTFIGGAERCWRFAIEPREMVPDNAFVALFDQRYYCNLLMCTLLLCVVVDPGLAEQFFERHLPLITRFYIFRANDFQTAARDARVQVAMAVVARSKGLLVRKIYHSSISSLRSYRLIVRLNLITGNLFCWQLEPDGYEFF